MDSNIKQLTKKEMWFKICELRSKCMYVVDWGRFIFWEKLESLNVSESGTPRLLLLYWILRDLET